MADEAEVVAITAILSPLVQEGFIEESEILVATSAISKANQGEPLTAEEQEALAKVEKGQFWSKVKGLAPLAIMGAQMAFGRRL